MTREDAVNTIYELAWVNTEMTKRANSGSGRISKKLLAEERKAIVRLFVALTGNQPNDEELKAMQVG